jgi:YggT family protein
MFLFGNFLFAFGKVLQFALQIYLWIIIIRIILSWVSPDPYNPLVKAVYNVTEPVLGRIRRHLPVSFGGLDLSPIIVFMIIEFLQYAVVNSIFQIAAGLIIK